MIRYATLLALLVATPLFTDVSTIDAAELASRIRKQDSTLVVLDVRTAKEFAAGHIPGAINIPYDQLPARISEVPEAVDRDVVLYCLTGKRTQMAIDRLRPHGYSRLLHLQGDFQEWQAKQQPVEK